MKNTETRHSRMEEYLEFYTHSYIPHNIIIPLQIACGMQEWVQNFQIFFHSECLISVLFSSLHPCHFFGKKFLFLVSVVFMVVYTQISSVIHLLQLHGIQDACLTIKCSAQCCTFRDNGSYCMATHIMTQWSPCHSLELHQSTKCA